jgi:hypothetical protein
MTNMLAAYAASMPAAPTTVVIPSGSTDVIAGTPRAFNR